MNEPIKIFISYSHKDKSYLEDLTKHLQSLKRQKLIQTWSAADIGVGTEWKKEIDTHLDTAQVFLLLVSADFLASDYCYGIEMNRAMERHKHGEAQVIPIILSAISEHEWNTAPFGKLQALPKDAKPIKSWRDKNEAYASVIDGIHKAIKELPAVEPPLPYKEGLVAVSLGAPNTPFAGLEPTRYRLDAASFSSYLRKLREECSQVFSHDLIRPNSRYVPQYASSDAEGSSEPHLLDITVVPAADTQRHVAILGNYGMGKTYFTWHITLEQIRHYEQGQQTQIPILFPLRKFRYDEFISHMHEPIEKQKDIIGQLLDTLFLQDFPRIDRKHFLRRLEDGRFTLILDGLDELSLPQTVSWQDVLKPLSAVDGLAFLVTSRTAYIQDPQRDLAIYDVFDLLPWSPREWHHYLELSMSQPDRDVLLAALAQKPRLASLTTRPLWCFMIVSIADEVASSDDLDLSGLYQRFLNHAMQRRPGPQALLTEEILKPADQYCAMECLAEEYMGSREPALSEPDVERLLSRLFQDVGIESLRKLITDRIRTYTFLNCDQDKRYNFGHTSFEDYFMASSTVRWLAEQANPAYRPGPKRIGSWILALNERLLSDEQMQFVLGILQEHHVMQSLGIVPSTGDQQLHTRIVNYLQNIFTTETFDEDVLDEKQLRMRINMLRIYIEMLRVMTKGQPVRIVGFYLRQLNLAGLNLAHCIFHKVDFTKAILSNTSFVGSSFAECTFFGAIIEETDFSEADLAGANFIGVERPVHLPIFANAKGLQQIKVRDRERRFLFSSQRK